MGSGIDDWIYGHFFTIRVNDNSSHIELLNDVCLANLSVLNVESSLTLRSTVSRPVFSWNKAVIWSLRRDFYCCQTVAGMLIWGALSDERMGLSFITAAGPRQHSHSRARVPWDSRPYFTAPDSRHPFSLLRIAGLWWKSLNVRVTLRLAVYRQSVRLDAEPLETRGQNVFSLN
jgi:hypothetical protein